MSLTVAALRALMADLESYRIERTVSTNNTDKFSEAICAFSNDFPAHRLPGYLLIGVDDTGMPSGLRVTDRLLQSLGDLRSQGNILPLPAITVESIHLSEREGDVIVITTLPSDVPPVRYKGRCFIRVGPRRAIASETEERILTERRAAAAVTFDARAATGTTLDDLSLDLFKLTYLPNAVAPEVIEENDRELPAQLASLRFYDLARAAPAYGGILLFGKDPLRFVPGAYLQFVRYDGADLASDVLDEHQFSGDLLTILRDLDSFVPLQIERRPEQSSALREVMVEEYPVIALRELLMNAVMHRWYDSSTAPIRVSWFSDRVEIQSPGGLYGEVTPESFGMQTAYRNPVIAEAMKVLGYVNRYGRGVARVRDALQRNGSPPPEFSFQPTFVLAIIRKR